MDLQPPSMHLSIIARRLFLCYFSLLWLLGFQTCKASDKNYCPPSSCGNITDIRSPFRLETDPKHCGDRLYSLSCENNSTVLQLKPGKYFVRAINYINFTIRIVDPGVQEDNCSLLPLFPLGAYSFREGDPYVHKYKRTGCEQYQELSQSIVFLNCEVRPANSPLYVNATPCTGKENSYVIVGEKMNASDLTELCSIEGMTMLPFSRNYKNTSITEIHRKLVHGFELSWFNIICRNCSFSSYSCNLNNSNILVACDPGGWISVTLIKRIVLYFSNAGFLLVCLQGAKTLSGSPFVIAFLIYKWRRRHLSIYDTVEEFLQNQSNLMPVRYSYSDIKKITGGFKEKLGEGGFGSVYKGKLRSGHLAAIKMLGKPKANGQEFISEVATIGRIHHVNVVKLIGFCVEGSKRALVYDFMPKGSLDKYIFPREESISLSWENLYKISLGVARGIEYLHRGCNMQILHFDIKPHNILLDEDFTPKISDFGLAKFYSRNESISSLTAARGTIGYMAPELFYKNIGRVSYKADVYSFGMLLLEMAGKKKNVKASAQNSSQYFPYCVYDQVFNGTQVEITDATKVENRISKKMTLVGLQCIQFQPSNRPSMNQVVDMLEGDLEDLQLPPIERVMDDGNNELSFTAMSSFASHSTESTSLIMSFNQESMESDRM